MPSTKPPSLKPEKRQHTPGPWTIERIAVSANKAHTTINGARIIGSDGVRVGSVTPKADKPIDQKYADADLIAAAPDMLAALREVMEDLGGLDDIHLCDLTPNTVRLVNAAVAKAEGDKP